MKLTKLYHRRSDGKLQTWEIEIENNAYRTHSGIENGKIVTTAWTTCVGKNIGKANATTDAEQAELEARAEWKKKLERKYSEHPEEVDKAKYFQPMLAKSLDDYKDRLTFPAIVQRKYDGIRIVGRKEGLFSRQGKRFTSLPHIEQALKVIFEKHPTLILDGEGYADKYAQDFNKICSIIKRKESTAEDLLTAKSIDYMIYDCFIPENPSAPYSVRLKFLEGLIREIPNLVLVETFYPKSLEEMDKLYYEFIDSGFEGQMIRFDTPYECKRTSNLLKRKEFVDAEFEVLGFAEGVGNAAGSLATVHCMMPNNQEFDPSIKAPMSVKKQLWAERNKLIGRSVTVEYFKQLTPAGKPRYPRVIKWDREEYE